MDINKGGTVIKPWYWLQEGLLANPNMILLVEYNDLTQKPEETMRRVYDFIGKDYYENHDYENVEYSNDPFDLKISTPDLHTVSGRVEYHERETILPQQILDKYSGYEFWRQENNSKKNKEPTANLLYS
jgi:sulfotransferase